MHRSKILFVVALLSFLHPLKAQIVSTKFGQIKGSLNGTVYQFLGIPFAKPPVGLLRWKAPQNPDTWSGALSTTSFAPVCPQKNFKQGATEYTLEGNEDCLYLNVWTPQLSAGNRPVMVFIHGGGNQQGSASEVSFGTKMFLGKNLAERGKVVVVTIQYRLGPLGFLVHPGLEAENTGKVSGNYAVLDQILALNWVKNNIANFGGDPKNVMIFGESAGGVNVGNLLNSPLAAGLFQRACIQSAIPSIKMYTDEKQKGIAFVDNYKKNGSEIEKISYMRSLPSDELVKNESSPLSGGIAGSEWHAVVDGSVFFDFPNNNFQNGKFNQVPLIIGSNSEEMSLSAPQTVLSGMLGALINTSIPAAYQSQAAQLYPTGSTNEQTRQSYVNLLTDAQFTSTTRRTAECISQNQKEPVWRYFFTHKHTLLQLATYGSYHGMELFYVFNNWENTTFGSGILFKAQDDSVQSAMLNYWTNFAKTGDPNGAGLSNWPEFEASTDNYLEIKATPVGKKGLRTNQSDFWDRAIGFVKCTGLVGNKVINENNSLILYPNPTNGIVLIQSSIGVDNLLVQVFNSKGIRILETINASHLDLTHFSSGIYLIIISKDGSSWQTKIMKR